MASQKHNIKVLCIAGGVSANSGLRKSMLQLQSEGYSTYIPKFEYCTDNAAMIGIVGYYKYLQHDFSEVSVMPYSRTGV